MPSVARIFGRHFPIKIPSEFADETALLKYLGISAKELKKIWWYRRRMYHKFSIAKGHGKTRLICAPDRRLKIIQRKLASTLNQIYRRRNPVHGFVLDRSVKTNAEAHGSRRYVVNLDLQDFFPSITENRIRGLLQSLGIDSRVSEIIARLTCFEASLPQGAPTSPVLSNMICYRLDTELLRVARAARAIYTRYADDITFSGHQPPSPLFEISIPAVGKFSPELLSPDLRNVIEGNGFVINTQKAHYADRNSRRIVTGVKINDGLNVDRRYIRNIRAMIHSIEKSGVIGAEARYSASGGKGSIEAHLRGKISYIAHLKGAVDPVVRSLATRFNRSFPDSPIKVVPTIEEMRDRAIWIIEHDHDGGRQGTAFFLKGVGLVTAAHCMENAFKPIVYHRTSSSNAWPVKVAKSCKYRDLAILEHSISVNEYHEMEASSRASCVSDYVVAYGYPGFGPGDQLNVRVGKVTSLSVKSSVRRIEVDQELSQGMSGGPVVNADGYVVGVVHKGGPDEARQVAIDVRELLKLTSE